MPREYLEVPELWRCSEAEVEWKLAVDFNDALHLARSRERHALEKIRVERYRESVPLAVKELRRRLYW